MSRMRKCWLGKLFHQISLPASLWGIFLINDWHQWAQPAAGGSNPEEVHLGCIRKPPIKGTMVRTSKQHLPQCFLQLLVLASKFQASRVPSPSMKDYELSGKANPFLFKQTPCSSSWFWSWYLSSRRKETSSTRIYWPQVCLSFQLLVAVKNQHRCDFEFRLKRNKTGCLLPTGIL